MTTAGKRTGARQHLTSLQELLETRQIVSPVRHNDDSREEDKGKAVLDSSLLGLLETRQVLRPVSVRCNDGSREEKS